MLFTNTL